MNKKINDIPFEDIPYYKDTADVWFDILDISRLIPMEERSIVFKTKVPFIGEKKETFKQKRRFIYQVKCEGDFWVGLSIKNDNNVIKNMVEIYYTCKDTNIKLSTIRNVVNYEMIPISDELIPLYILNDNTSKTSKNVFYVDIINEYNEYNVWDQKNIQVYIILKTGMIKDKTINRIKFTGNDQVFKIDRKLIKLIKV